MQTKPLFGTVYPYRKRHPLAPASGPQSTMVIGVLVMLSTWTWTGASKVMAIPIQNPPQQELPQGVIRSAEGSEPWPEQTWPEQTEGLTELPEAPAEFDALKRDGNVKFVFYDSSFYKRKFTGETKFTIQFESKSTFRWRQIREGTGKRYLVIRTNFRKPEFKLQHQILLPTYLADEQFYESALVKHEFDHVRISVDPRFRETFSKSLERELKVVRVELDGPKSEPELQALVSKEMNDRANLLFQKMLDLVQIRYQELDRVTRHGTRALPETFFEAN